jgi:hypothetical protein
MKRPNQPRPVVPPSQLVPLRTPSGHLVGYYDARRCVLQVKSRAGRPVEEIDLRPVLGTPEP